MNNIAENSFGATMRSIIPADYYEEKLMNFHAFEKWWELAHLGDVIKKTMNEPCCENFRFV